MAYSGKLSLGQTIYLDCAGGQTTISIASGSPGQQQQSSRTFETGSWTAPPELYETPNGATLKLITERGEIYVQIQGSNASVARGEAAAVRDRSLPLQEVAEKSVSPMEPMKPMKIGDPSANANTMEMRMGNLEMRMGTPSPEPTRRFCSQCGAPVASEDRFCSNCGHQFRSV